MNSLTKSMFAFSLVRLAGLAIACGSPQDSGTVVTVANNSAQPQKDAVVFLDPGKLGLAPADLAAQQLVAVDGNAELATEATDLNGDGAMDALVVAADFQAQESKKLVVRKRGDAASAATFPKRTQAELSQKFDGKFENRKYVGGEFRNVNSARVPVEHTDHSLFFRYEGPGWESDKVGYRFYLDWRNAIDIFGKKGPARSGERRACRPLARIVILSP